MRPRCPCKVQQARTIPPARPVAPVGEAGGSPETRLYLRKEESVLSAGIRAGVSRGRCSAIGGRRHEPAPAAPADLTALAARGPGFIGRPFVRGALFVRRAASLARNLTLLFGRHRGKSTAFFAYSVHSLPPDSRTLRAPVTERLRRAPPVPGPVAPGQERVGVRLVASPGRRLLDPFQASGRDRPGARSRSAPIPCSRPASWRRGRRNWTTRCVPAQQKPSESRHLLSFQRVTSMVARWVTRYRDVDRYRRVSGA